MGRSQAYTYTVRPRYGPRTLVGWQNVIAAAPKFGIDLEKKRKGKAITEWETRKCELSDRT